MNADRIPGIWFALSGVVYLVGLPACFLVTSFEFTIGFATGGALVLLNAWMSARRVRQADFPNRGRVMASLLGGFYLRLILLGVCLYAFIKFMHVDPVGLVTGLSVVPVGLFVMLVLIYVANRRRPEEV
jgi:hypothetical protein